MLNVEPTPTVDPSRYGHHLQCLPLPLMPAKGFSCRSRGEVVAAGQDDPTITSWLWSEATLASSKMGAVSYWARRHLVVARLHGHAELVELGLRLLPCRPGCGP